MQFTKQQRELLDQRIAAARTIRNKPWDREFVIYRETNVFEAEIKLKEQLGQPFGRNIAWFEARQYLERGVLPDEQVETPGDFDNLFRNSR